MKAPLPLRVLVLAAGEAQTRQAMPACRALAAAGAEVHLVSDAPADGPASGTGLPGRLWRHRPDAPLEGLAGAGLDWTILAASAALSPRFVAGALEHAGRLGTRLALLAPAALPPGHAEDIRRLGWLASLVISPGAGAQAAMRGLLDGAQPRFEIWHPAIDSHLARHALDEPRDGSLLAPVPNLATLEAITQLPAEALRGRVLRLLTSAPLPDEALAPLRAHAQLEVMPMPEEPARLRLLARAAVLLLPGPEQADAPWAAEAAYLGTPCLGASGTPWIDRSDGPSASPPDRLAELLAQGEATRESRDRARDMFGLEGAGQRLADLLLRAAPAAAACRAGAMGLIEMQAGEAVPGSPLMVMGACRLPDGRALISLRGALPDGVELHQPQAAPARIWRSLSPGGETICHLLLSGARASLMRGEDVFLHLAIRALEHVPHWQMPRVVMQAPRFDGEERVLDGTVTTGLPLAGIAFSPDGARWFQPPLLRRGSAPGTTDGLPQLGFRLRLPARIPLEGAAARMLLLDRAGAAIGLLQGWPPHPTDASA
ncbi:hypothetical protein EOD42_23405 [Rhodovarius crocodyli]|uniref:Uncharacterized protein n=1 Tax=Rhodovarius crocodyli TaxID=1979269 RepID=A0A437LYW2_9PROT|nr:hypothetical protein [Rhodovarius crocodyli]RVT90582.1 hypothetical protein EOD42_23405 [Rhodovarius crocodyli]